MNEYPEHEKLKAVKDRSQAIGEFLEWLQEEKGLSICKWSDEEREYLLAYVSTQALLAEFFKIDRKKLEEEKEGMLEAFREKTS
jgi:hypothetical protein